MKMQMVVEMEGTLSELLREATTGSLITLGTSQGFKWAIDEKGKIFFHREGDFFTVGEYGGKVPRDAVTNFSLEYTIPGKTCHRRDTGFIVLHAGRLSQELGRYECLEWKVGVDGIYLEQADGTVQLLVVK
ncbi:MAG: hypothetical protein K9M10_03060 [Candidatus Pacebacteria bacterium]|nr:hypothetical protein [Candidatus Paceibacterota bacterium]MCF7857433.1 hypothetical protein [Candidatus Paceibacterota bacterium]